MPNEEVMTCTRCGSDDISRSRRQGIWDHISARLGRWPFRCEDCGVRFVAPYRSVTQADAAAQATFRSHRAAPSHSAPGREFRSYAEDAGRTGPDMAFRTHPARPQAKIVVQADNHEQLNNILLALDRAVSSYQSTSKEQDQREKTTK